MTHPSPCLWFKRDFRRCSTLLCFFIIRFKMFFWFRLRCNHFLFFLLFLLLLCLLLFVTARWCRTLSDIFRLYFITSAHNAIRQNYVLIYSHANRFRFMFSQAIDTQISVWVLMAVLLKWTFSKLVFFLTTRVLVLSMRTKACLEYVPYWILIYSHANRFRFMFSHAIDTQISLWVTYLWLLRWNFIIQHFVCFHFRKTTISTQS